MKIVLKWPLELAESQIIEMPIGSKMLDVQIQPTPLNSDQLVLWTESDIDVKYDSRMIYIVGTGQPRDLTNCEYIASVQMGRYVWHVYQVSNQLKTLQTLTLENKS